MNLRAMSAGWWRPYLLVGLVVALWFAPWWLGGRCLAPLDLMHRMMSPWAQGSEGLEVKNHMVADGVDQYLVYRKIAEDSYRRGEEVGWSSLTYGGTVQRANTMALYDDWTMELHRWMDFWSAWHLGLMGQFLLAGWGMVAWVRGRGVTWGWAACAGVLYAFNSQFVVWVYHRWALGAFCWVPWIFAAAERGEKGSRAGRWAAPWLVAMSFLGGTLQHAALVVVAVAVHALAPGENEESWWQGWRRWRRCAGWGLLGAGLAAFMWLPCVVAFVESSRLGLHTGMHGSAENGPYPDGWLQPFYHLVSYPFQLFPSLLGRVESVDLWKLLKSELFYVAYFGGIAGCLAWASVWKRCASKTAGWLMAAGLVLPLTPLVRYLYQRLYLLMILGGILAFAEMVSRSGPRERQRMAKWGGRVLAAWAVLWLAASAGMKATEARWQPQVVEAVVTKGEGSAFGYYRKWLEQRAQTLIDDLYVWSPAQAVPLALLAVGIWGWRRMGDEREGWRRAGRVMVSCGAMLEVLWWAGGWVSWNDPRRWPLFPETVETEMLRREVGAEGRTVTKIHPTAHMAKTPFVPNLLAAYGIASLHGYDSIVPDGMEMPVRGNLEPQVVGRLAVTHLIAAAGDEGVPEGWRKVGSTAAMDLYENPQAMPKAMGWAKAEDERAFRAGGGDAGEALTMKREGENSRVIEVPGTIRWVRLAENAHPGWRWRVDGGEWKAVERGEDRCMWMEVGEGAGERRLELRFRDPWRVRGWWLTGCSLVVWGGWVGWSWRKRRPAELS